MVPRWDIGDQAFSLPLSSSVGTSMVGSTDSASGRWSGALIWPA